jgi:hypothetical protein
VARLEELTRGASVKGILPNQTVTVVDIRLDSEPRTNRLRCYLTSRGYSAANRENSVTNGWGPQVPFAVGSIVNARGLDWIVLPSATKDVLNLKPVTGVPERGR